MSPDGRWITAASPNIDEEHMASMKAFPVDGGPPVTVVVGGCVVNWDTAGRYAYITFLQSNSASYALPVMHDVGLPKLPPGGVRKQDLKNGNANIAIHGGCPISRKPIRLRIHPRDHSQQSLPHPFTVSEIGLQSSER